MTQRTALVVGATGIVGGNLSERLVEDGWTVFGLSRRPDRAPYGVRKLAADLNDREAVADAIKQIPSLTHLFYASWTPAETEEEACEINGRQLSNVLNGIEAGQHSLVHVVLVTGVKHYLGPFKDFGRFLPETPFLEETPRLPLRNFYYDQEDILFAAAQRLGFTWSVHRPNTVVGYAVGSLMNNGVTLACYASICKEAGLPFVFTGVAEQWEMLTEISDAKLVARQACWAATSPAGRDLAFNTGNGDIFRWKHMWGKIADYFELSHVRYEGQQRNLADAMSDAPAIWSGMASKYGLVEPDISRLATWWHTDADLRRKVECISDMTRSRKAGFLDYQSSTDTYLDLFRRLANERIIPKFHH